METRASMKRANTNQQPPQVIVLKRQRVVLGEIPDLSFPQFQTKHKLQVRKNPNNLNNSAKPLPSIDSNLDKSVPRNNNPIRSNEEINEPYVSDIFDYLRTIEMQKKRRPMVGYMENVQRDITSNMRGTLIDWLVEVADEYKLLPETLHLSVSYIDRFLSLNTVHRSKLQLLGVSSMLIASKYEEITPPKAIDFCQITDNTYDLAELKMEADILKSLNFEMGSPNVSTFLKRFVGIASENPKTSNLQFEYLCNYLAELSLLDYECIRFLPSVVAASIIFLARFIIRPGVHPWTSSLCECLGYESTDLEECVTMLHDLYLSRRAASFKAVREKYKQQKFKTVANLPSPPEVPSNYFEEE